jgi:hypothetical protein
VGHGTALPFSCPFGAPKTGKLQQTPAQSEGQKSPDSRSDGAGSGNVQHTRAKGNLQRLIGDSAQVACSECVAASSAVLDDFRHLLMLSCANAPKRRDVRGREADGLQTR